MKVYAARQRDNEFDRFIGQDVWVFVWPNIINEPYVFIRILDKVDSYTYIVNEIYPWLPYSEDAVSVALNNDLKRNSSDYELYKPIYCLTTSELLDAWSSTQEE